MDSDIAEHLLSKTSRKQQRHDTGPLDVPPRGVTEFPNAEPMEVGPHTILLPIGSEKQAPETMVPAVTVMPPSHWHHCCGERETPLLPSRGNGPVHLGKPRCDSDHGTKCAM